MLDRWPEARKALAGYIKDGSLIYDDTELHGIKSFPGAMIDILAGNNDGKMIVRLVD